MKASLEVWERIEERTTDSEWVNKRVRKRDLWMIM